MMKRIFTFGLILTLLSGLTFNAKAELSVTVTWDTPGSLAPYANIGDSDVEVSNTATSQTFTLDKTWGYLKMWPANGWYFENATTEGDNTISPSTYVYPTTGLFSYNPTNGISIDLSKYGDGQTVHLNIAQIKRENLLTVNVVNGLANINKFEFESGYTPTLKKGKNQVYYNPDVDGKLGVQFAGNGPDTKPYLFTLNDEEASTLYSAPLVVDNDYTHSYTINIPQIATNDDNYLYIQVFENNDEEPDTFDLTINYGEGMGGCLSNIYNRTTGNMTYSAEFEDGIITGLSDLIDGTELRLNFLSDDFTITDILVNDVSMKNYIENEGDNIQQYFTLTITENTTLTINGNATVWNDITYTGYVSDPEGIQFGLDMETYNLDYKVVGNVGGNTYGVLTMPEGSKEIQLTVSQKNNNGKGTFFFKPKEGYFITVCYLGTPDDGQATGTQSVNAAMGYEQDGYSFYIIVDKLEPEYTANLNVIDSSGYPEMTYIKGSNEYSEQNDNPAQSKIEITQAGESEISFIPNYDNPFTLYLNQNQTARIYLDGAEVSGSANKDTNQTEYPLPLYAPAEGETSDIHSDVQVYFTGAPTMSNVSLTLENNATAEFYYSPVMRTVDGESISVIQGTLMTVKPTSANAVVLYKGTPQTLDANGMFQFTTGSTTEENNVTVTGPKSIKLSGMLPKAGSVVKSLAGVTLLVPMTADDEEISMGADLDKLNQTVVVLNGTTIATIEQVSDLTELEATPDESGNNLLVPIKFNKIIADAGEDYFVKVPEGAFVQKEWDEGSSSMVSVPGGYVSAAFSGRFDVDPTLLSAVEKYTLTPADGETVPEISNITISFSDIPKTVTFSGTAQFTKDDVTINADIRNDWNSEAENCVITVTPINDDEEEILITEAGEWTLTIAEGTFEYEGESSPVITAKYTVESVENYTLSPDPGTIRSLSAISVTFKNVEVIEEVEGAVITLVGPEYNATALEVGVASATKTVNLSFPTATTDGEYTLTIPAGAFKLDGEDSELITAVYTLKKGWTLTPTPGTTVESLDEFVLVFTDATEVEFSGSATSFILGNEANTYAAPGFDCVKVENAEQPTFTITLIESAQKPANGNYKFIIDEGTFTVDGERSAEIYAEYTLDAEVTTEYMLDPPTDTPFVLNSWLGLTVMFDKTATITTVPEKSNVSITINDETIPADAYGIEIGMNMVMFSISDKQYWKAGTLKLTINAGAFKIGENDSPAISGTWELIENKTFEVEVSSQGKQEGNRMSDMSQIILHFPEATSVEISKSWGASLRTNSYSYSRTAEIEIISSEALTRSGNGVSVALKFNPAPTEQNKEYVLNVMEGTLILDGSFESPAIEETYILDQTTGIFEIYADENGNVTVYTLEGKVVLKNVPAVQLRELEKGLYIINGKKTLVK